MNYSFHLTYVANQRLVHEAFAHLSKTQQLSMENGTCCYTGSGCAFSPAIQPEYLAKHHNTNAASVIMDHPEHLHEWAQACDPNFANYVQNCHDRLKDSWDVQQGPAFVEAFKHNLEQLISDYGMTLEPSE